MAGIDGTDTQVIVVGAGPVGLMLAGELRLGGAEVTVLERLAAPTTESRASTLHARTMEMLDQRGLLALLGTPPNDMTGHFGGVPLHYGEQATRYPGQWKVPQTRVEALLAEWAGGLGADIRREHEVRGLTVAGDHVDVEVAGPDGTSRLTAAYVVGCDGEESAVRRLAGFEFAGTDATKELLRADVTGVQIPNRRFERLPNGLAIASTRDGVTRVMVHEFGREAVPRTADPEFAEIAEVWARVTGEDISGGTPTWVNAFGNANRQVTGYRRGRVLLAGDAAHRQMPTGGQAINLGLQDAANLGWKLALVATAATGRAPDALLDTYHDERHAVGKRVLANIVAQSLLLLGGPEVEATRSVLGELLGHEVVRQRLAGAIGGLDIRYGAEPGDHPLVGARLPHADLTTESGPRGTAELLRTARGVLLDLSAESTRAKPARKAALAKLAAGWAGRVDLVPAVAAPGSGIEGATTVLLRPDGYVAWAGERTADLRAALTRWFGPAEKSTQETRTSDIRERDASMPSKTKATIETKGSPAVQHCDVIIIGSGLAGSVSGAILARQGAKVVLVDASQHPRFAIGESMTPQLIEWLHILSERYDVPEIANLLDVKAVTKNIGAHHGRKQSFGFMFHRPHEEPDPREATQFVIPKLLTEASHLYRQDTDQYYFNVAASYGCVTRQNWSAADLDFDDTGVTVTGQNGEVFRGKYLIDASGFRSLLADKFDLREKPARFKHHSRSLFTHYVGVKPFDDVSHHPMSLRPDPASPWNGGTMHHIIERGWFWIIPFNNFKGSKNPVCSVGLTFDERRYPKPTDMTPEEEFNHYLDLYPAVKRQFEGAHRVREWVSTDRLQYSSKQSIGYRWCLMSHAAGFLDPLFSRGLSNTFEVVYALVSRLLESLKDDDFSVERFEYVDKLERGLLQYNDDLVNSSYISFSHFRLWNAVYRVWGSFLTPGVMRLTKARLNYAIDHDERHFKELEDTLYPGLWWPESHEFKNILEVTAETCEKYEVGELTGDEAADVIFKMLNDSALVNHVFGWKDPEDRRFMLPTTATMARFMFWGATSAPPEMRSLIRATASGIFRSGIRGKKVL